MLRRVTKTMLLVVSAVSLIAAPGFAQDATRSATGNKNGASAATTATNAAGTNTANKKFVAQQGTGQNRMHRHHGQHHRRMTGNRSMLRMNNNAGQNNQWTPAKGTTVQGTNAKGTAAKGATQTTPTTAPKKATTHPTTTKTKSTHQASYRGTHHVSHRYRGQR